MRQFISLTSILLAGIAIVGCSNSNKNEFEGIPAQELYSKGQQFLQDGDYNNAIRYLEAVDVRGQQGYGEQIQLSMIYAQYKLGEYYKALDAAERFVRTYPNSASMDYVFNLAGLSNARLADNWLQNYLGVNDSARAVDNVRNAYGSFQTLVQNFPHSQYAKDAQMWIDYMKNRLAEHDLHIAKFYIQRDAYVAVVNRVEEMLRMHPDAKATYDALPLMKKSFEAMGIHDSAEKVAKLIEEGKTKEFPTYQKPEYPAQF